MKSHIKIQSKGQLLPAKAYVEDGEQKTMMWQDLIDEFFSGRDCGKFPVY